MFDAAIAVGAPGPSYGGLTSTTSYPEKRRPRRARTKAKASRVVGPPASGVPLRAHTPDRGRRCRRRGRRPARRRVRGRATPYSSAAESDELLAGDDVEAELCRHARVLGPVQRAAHAGEQRSPGIEQPFLDCTPERRAVVEALPDVGVPHVGMSVEEDEAEGTVDGCMRPQLPEYHRVISTETQRPRSRTHDRLEVLRDLRGRPLRIAGRDRDVAQVRDRRGPEHLSLLDRVVRPERNRGTDRTASGPNRAPGLFVVPVSKGIPRTATSTPSGRRRADSARRSGHRRSEASERVGRLVARASVAPSRRDGPSWRASFGPSSAVERARAMGVPTARAAPASVIELCSLEVREEFAVRLAHGDRVRATLARDQERGERAGADDDRTRLRVRGRARR